MTVYGGNNVGVFVGAARIFILVKRFLLLVCQRFTEFLSVPGNQFHQFLQLFVSTGALLEGGNVAVLKKYCCLFLFILKIRNYSKIHRNFKKIY